MRRNLSTMTKLTLCLILAIAIAAPASAQDEILDGELTRQERGVLASLEPTHQTEVDLSPFRQPILTLANPDAETELALRLVALDSETNKVRSVFLRLEAGGSTDLSLASKAGFDYLSLLAEGAFHGEVTDAGQDELRQSVVSRPISGGIPFAKSSEHVCTGNWTLTCTSPSSCTYQHTAAGDVYFQTPFTYLVYWNLHTPIGSWVTKGVPDCTTTWSRDLFNPGCPKMAHNCFQQDYVITGAQSLVDD